MSELNRYNLITNKFKREMLLLVGTGCFYSKCAFCDYHLDKLEKEKAFEVNKKVLDRVTGVYKRLEIVNSGSFLELDDKTINYIKKIINDKKIETLIVESHYYYRNELEKIKEIFSNINVEFKIGVETFNADYRENVLKKGMGKNVLVEDIKKYFSQVCLLFGIKGQTKEDFLLDLKIARENFKRVCINIFNENTTPLKADTELIEWFKNEIYDSIKDEEDIDILIANTDLGVG